MQSPDTKWSERFTIDSMGLARSNFLAKTSPIWFLETENGNNKTYCNVIERRAHF